MRRWMVLFGVSLAALVPGAARALCVYGEPTRASRACGINCAVAVLGNPDGSPPAGTHMFRSDDPGLPVVAADVDGALFGNIEGAVEFLVRSRGPLTPGVWQLEQDGVRVKRVDVTVVQATPVSLEVEDISEDRSDGECHDTGPQPALPEPDVRRERPLRLVIALDRGAELPADLDLDLWILAEGEEPPTDTALRDGTAAAPTLERFRPAYGLIRTRRVANQPVVQGGDVFTVALRGVHHDGSATPVVLRTFRVPTARVTCDCTGAAPAPNRMVVLVFLLAALGRWALRTRPVHR